MAITKSFLAASGLLLALAHGQATQPVSSVPSGAPVVDLGYASYLGYNNESVGITYYRGLQYAQVWLLYEAEEAALVPAHSWLILDSASHRTDEMAKATSY